MNVKVIVLFLTLVGVVGGGGLGIFWLKQAADEDARIKVWEQRESNPTDPQSQSARMRRQQDKMVQAAYGMIAGVSVGLIAALLFAAGKLHPLIAGIVLVGSSVAAGILETRGIVFSSPLLLAGGVCFLMKRSSRQKASALAQSKIDPPVE